MNSKHIVIIGIILTSLANAVFCADISNSVSDRITKAITGYLMAKDTSLAGKRMEVSYKYADRVFKELKYRKGLVTFSVAELYPDFKPLGNVIVPIQVNVDGEDKEKIFLRTKVSVFDRIVVAKKRLKRGDLIQGEEATIEVRDIAALSSNAVKDISLVMGKESKTFIPQGNPIYEWMIKERPLVKKNEKVKIEVNAENIVVVAGGMSMEDGALGQSIKVKNLTSGKELVAVVTGTGEVAVK